MKSKKALSLFLSLTLAAGFTPCLNTAFEAPSIQTIAATKYGDILYEIKQNQLIIYAGNRTLASVNVPSEINGKPVEVIGDYAFSSCSVASISLPSTLKTINTNAFYQCDALTSITIPGSVTSINKSAFYDCSALTSVTFNEGLETIGEAAFAYCLKLGNVVIPSTVTNIQKSAFHNDAGMNKITILNPNCTIFDSASTFHPNTVICAPKGSTAEAYANKYSRKFEVSNGAVTPTATTTTITTTTTTKATTTTTTTTKATTTTTTTTTPKATTTTTTTTTPKATTTTTTTPKATTTTTTTPKATTTTTTTTPKQTQDGKLQWEIGKAQINSGSTDTVWIDVLVSEAWGTDPATEGIRGAAAGFVYDTRNFTLTEIDTESCYGSLTYNTAEALVSVTPALNKDEGIIAKEGDAICYLGFTPNADVAAGTYPIKWNKNETKAILDPGSYGENAENRPAKFAELDLVDGAIIVNAAPTTTTTTKAATTTTTTTTKAATTTTTTTPKATTTTTTTTPKATTTTTTATTTPVTTTTKPQPIIQDSDLQWKIYDAEMQYGATDTIWVDVVVSNEWGTDAATEGIRGVAAGFKYDTEHFTLTEFDSESCYGSLTGNAAEALVSITPTLSKDEGIIAKKGDVICYLGFTPKNNDVPNGTYPITWDKDATKVILDPGSYGNENTRPVKFAKLNLIDGSITVRNGGSFTLGDVDESGIIDASDASDVLAAYAAVQTGGDSPLSENQKKAADVDGSTVIDASDASTILAFYTYAQTGGKKSFEEYLKG